MIFRPFKYVGILLLSMFILYFLGVYSEQSFIGSCGTCILIALGGIENAIRDKNKNTKL